MDPEIRTRVTIMKTRSRFLLTYCGTYRCYYMVLVRLPQEAFPRKFEHHGGGGGGVSLRIL